MFLETVCLLNTPSEVRKNIFWITTYAGTTQTIYHNHQKQSVGGKSITQPKSPIPSSGGPHSPETSTRRSQKTATCRSQDRNVSQPKTATCHSQKSQRVVDKKPQHVVARTTTCRSHKPQRVTPKKCNVSQSTSATCRSQNRSTSHQKITTCHSEKPQRVTVKNRNVP